MWELGDRPARPDCIGDAARGMIGAPFRLHGLDPRTGLDCVGLIYASLVAMGRKAAAPRGYGLRNVVIGQWIEFAEKSGLELSHGPVAANEVLLVRLGYGQHHLMIADSLDSVIHAHAGLRRVVTHRFDPKGEIDAKWRVAPRKKG